MKYVKKPIPVHAVQWFPAIQHKAVTHDVDIPVDENGDVKNQPGVKPYFCRTLENQSLYLTPGCWIVGPGSRGEYWPVQDDIFQATYERYD